MFCSTITVLDMDWFLFRRVFLCEPNCCCCISVCCRLLEDGVLHHDLYLATIPWTLWLTIYIYTVDVIDPLLIMSWCSVASWLVEGIIECRPRTLVDTGSLGSPTGILALSSMNKANISERSWYMRRRNNLKSAAQKYASGWDAWSCLCWILFKAWSEVQGTLV